MSLETFHIIDEACKSLNNGLNEAERRLKSFGQNTVRTMAKVGATIDTVRDRYLTRFDSMLDGKRLLSAGREVMDFNSRITRLAITAGKSGRAFYGFKKDIFATALATHQSADAVVDYMGAVLEKTGNFDLAMKSMKQAGTVALATGSSMADIGATAANLWQKMGIGPKEMFKTLDILNSQAKAGSVEFSKYADFMDRLTAASSKFNLKGVKGVRVLGVWVREAKQAGGSTEEAAAGIEHAISDMQDPRKIKLMKSFGFNPVDTKASKKAGITVMKDMESVIKGIIKVTNGNRLKLGHIFGREGFTAISHMAQTYRQTGGFGEFDLFKKADGDGAKTMKDFTFMAGGAKAKTDDLHTLLMKIANTGLMSPRNVLAKSSGFLSRHEALTKAGMYGLHGLKGIRKGIKIYKDVREVIGAIREIWFGKGDKGTSGGVAGRLAGAGAYGGAVPVYVVNKNLSLLQGRNDRSGLDTIRDILADAEALGGIAEALEAIVPLLGEFAAPLTAIGVLAAGSYWLSKKAKESGAGLNILDLTRQQGGVSTIALPRKTPRGWQHKHDFAQEARLARESKPLENPLAATMVHSMHESTAMHYESPNINVVVHVDNEGKVTRKETTVDGGRIRLHRGTFYNNVGRLPE